MPSASKGSFMSSFRICMHFISISHLTAFVRTSNTTLSRNGEKQHHCLVLDLRLKHLHIGIYEGYPNKNKVFKR